MLAEPDETFLLEEKVYKQHYEQDLNASRTQTGTQLKALSRQHQQYFNDAVRSELKIPSVSSN
jgi:hypothetical protein